MAQSSRAMLRKGGLLGEFTDLLASVKHLFDSYHPERHYMRGLARQARCGFDDFATHCSYVPNGVCPAPRLTCSIAGGLRVAA